MKLRFVLFCFILVTIIPLINAQDLITFDDQGWSNDQSITSNITLGNYKFSSNNSFFTNYGYNFNINENSLYYVYKDPSTDKITIATKDDSPVNFLTVDVYQVSETSTGSLIIEGWNGSSKLYSKSFSSLGSWQKITLNYSSINKVIIKQSNSTSNNLVDYNFDNFSFDKSVAVTDTTSPALISASVITPTSIDLIFSETLDKISALNKSNYSINNGITVNSVAISSDYKKVTLSTTQNTANKVYTVVVSGVKDSAGNTISQSNNSAQYYYTGDSTPPELLSAQILDSVTVELLFSEKVDSVSANNKSNYSISNGISIEAAHLSSNLNKVTLQTTRHTSGQSYSIIVKNIFDLAGNLISDNNSSNYNYYIDNIPPDITEISVNNCKTITVQFSERLDLNTAINNKNYNISNSVTINQVQLLPDSTGVLLKTSQEQAGADYTLTITNIKDRVGNLISPNPKSYTYQIPAKGGGKHTKNSIQSATSNNWYNNFSPSKSIDGVGMSNPLSRWCSSKPLPDTIAYDLGNIFAIDSIRISFYDWETDGLYKYSVYASNDLSTWEPVVENVWSDNVEWTEIVFNAIEKRYIKVVLLESNQSSPASIWEIETYGAEKITGISTLDAIPQQFELSQNYPNPFNPSTTINYSLPKEGKVVLKVYDLLGNEVSTLVDESKPAGNYNVKFDTERKSLSSGIYIYKITTESYTSAKKMILLK